MTQKPLWLKLFTLLLLIVVTHSQAERVKDLATMAGVRANQLIGYGLVVGLPGTGDQTAQAPFTSQSFQSMLDRLGVRLPPQANLRLKNIAAVAISAELPPFFKPGQTIDVTVSSIGNATSLRGGTLLMTPLKGADGKVYALAQGNMVVNGINAQGADGSKISVNITSTGRIPSGATVERSVAMPYEQSGNIVYNLNRPDFTTAQRLAEAINSMIGKNVAEPLDAGSVQIALPQYKGKDSKKAQYERVAMIADIENLTLEAADAPGKIIVNSRTGTIVIGQHVRVSPAVVSHGSLTVSISEDIQTSQPAPLSQGQTVQTPSSDVQVEQPKNKAFVFAPGTSLKDLVNAINKVGASPGDLVAILEALRSVGAINVELEVI